MEPTQSIKKRICFWLSDQVGALHRDYALELGRRGFDIQFFSSLEHLVTETRLRRPAVIIIGDEGQEQLVEKAILTITGMPDISGARLVMTISKHLENIKRFASCSSFRDLIPMNLEKNQWLQRFSFATSSSDSAIPKPSMQVTLNSIATVNAPARIVWITKDKIWLESRLKPHRGANIQITGPIAQAFGSTSLSATVVETRSSKLTYRFSDAVVAQWHIPHEAKVALDKILDELHQIDAGPRCRVFAAIQDASLRGSILKQLDVLQFEISTALHKMSVVEEPRFFSPHIVFIEDQLCVGEHQMRFFKMLANLDSEVPVVILGNKIRTEEAQAFAPHRKIFVLPRITQNFLTLLWKRFLPKESRAFRQRVAEDAIYIASDHLYSIAQINFPARITRLHPNSLQLSVPFPMSSYGLLQIQSPLLKKLWNRDPYAKVVQVFENKDPASIGFSYRAACLFSDADKEEQKKLGSALLRSLSDQFQQAPLNALRSVGPTPSVSYVEDSQQLQVIHSKENLLAQNQITLSPGAINPQGDYAQTIDKSISTTHAKNFLSLRDIGTADPSIDYHENTKPAPSVPHKQKVAKKDFEGLKNASIFVAITAGSLFLLWIISAIAAHNWNRSGSQYTESLRKFAPQKFEGSNDEEDKAH